MKQQLQAEIIALCDYAIVSKENKLTIAGIFDELRTTKPPAVLARGFLVATVNGTPNTSYQLIVELEHDRRKNIIPPANIDIFTSANGKNNIIMELIGVKFPEEGRYRFKIYSENIAVGHTQLVVMHSNQAQDIGIRKPN